jgi:hypothetical protein
MSVLTVLRAHQGVAATRLALGGAMAPKQRGPSSPETLLQP